MLNDTNYNKIKLLHELSGICWFLDKHALDDAQNCDDKQCIAELQSLHEDLKKHVEALKKSICSCCK